MESPDQIPADQNPVEEQQAPTAEASPKAKAPSAADMQKLIDELQAQNAAQAAKMAAIEEHLAKSAPAGAIGKAKEPKPLLTGDPFKVAGRAYRVKYPVMNIDAKTVSEEDVLADKQLQKRIVDDFPGLLVAL